jgi:8-oxo-dGTP pyrophosphatase MutT (NUDIX family)
VTETGFDPHAVPIRPAATVMLVRERHGRPEVFMLKRTMKAAFAAGAYVFPGGAVDPGDGGEVAEALCVGRSDAEASERLGIPAGGLAYWVAAIRECFEEAGVLLALDERDEIVRFDDAEVEQRFGAHRTTINAREGEMLDVIATERLRLAVGGIHYVSHWITPVGEVRRFDTRFFVAAAPAAQEPLHDDNETVDSLWVNPADALEMSARGELFMIPPTIANVRYLAGFDDVASLLADASTMAEPPPILPRLRYDGERVVGVVMPWEPDYATLTD